MIEAGNSGLRIFGGFVAEEYDPNLRGMRGMRMFREMSDSSPTIGAFVYVLTQVVTKLAWHLQPPDQTPLSLLAQQFYESLLDDMDHTWNEFIQEALSMVIYGYAPVEIVLKMRNGETTDKRFASKYKDGMIGIRKLALRSQETILRWIMDADNNSILGMVQMPWTGGIRMIPRSKMLLLRTRSNRNNPEGRALDPATPIPTPDGWRRLDTLAVGSKVFDEQGRVRYITARADWPDRPCYRLTFSDGSQIVADENHQWATQTIRERSRSVPAKLRTTAEIVASLKSSEGASNHSIEWTRPLDYPEQMLPLHPYFLGLWLGDGSSLSSAISCHADDLDETRRLIEECGYETAAAPNGDADGKGRLIRVSSPDSRWDRESPQALLTALGLRGNKHIPSAYLRGSVEQRLALLSGLMDSDGHADNFGRCEFTNCNKGLCKGVAQLARSLGCGATLQLRHRANGRDRISDSWAVRFTPTWAPFRLARKAAKVREARSRARHYIVAAEQMPPRRTVCIEVDGPSHMFLAGEGMVPTHNSLLRNAYRPYYFSKRIEEIEGIGVERDLAGFPVMQVPAEIISAATKGTDPDAAKTLQAYQNLVRNVKRNSQEGAVLPSDRDEHGNLLFELKLLASGGKRTFDTNVIIDRYQQQMASAVMADFLLLGHGQSGRGTGTLSQDKITMFYEAIAGLVSQIADVLNKELVPLIGELNGIPIENQPSFFTDKPEQVDIGRLGAYINALSASGMVLFPNKDLENYLLEVAGLPEPTDEVRAQQEEIQNSGGEAGMPGTGGAAMPGARPSPFGQEGGQGPSLFGGLPKFGGTAQPIGGGLAGAGSGPDTRTGAQGQFGQQKSRVTPLQSPGGAGSGNNGTMGY